MSEHFLAINYSYLRKFCYFLVTKTVFKCRLKSSRYIQISGHDYTELKLTSSLTIYDPDWLDLYTVHNVIN